ncbi:hypothetical protein LCGC14_1448360 [marine sediment metagenome]|uniref:Uncharacterized protein n=1 Tax=marine sediment metagenome TaxID=412755 RepID=A0A0F9LZ17_9ZZZZ
MELEGIIEPIKLALNKMNKNFCELSKIDYKYIEATNGLVDYLKGEKYLERPIAYEFYHQLRKLIDEGDVDFGEPIIQAEVDKNYQHCFRNGKMPDFIIHLPNFNKNLAIIEFKLATRKKEDIKYDFKKIVKFKTYPRLRYTYGIEVILGNKRSLAIRMKDINNWNRTEGEEIIIIEFDTDNWKANHSIILFNN